MAAIRQARELESDRRVPVFQLPHVEGRDHVILLGPRRQGDVLKRNRPRRAFQRNFQRHLDVDVACPERLPLAVEQVDADLQRHVDDFVTVGLGLQEFAAVRGQGDWRGRGAAPR